MELWPCGFYNTKQCSGQLQGLTHSPGCGRGLSCASIEAEVGLWVPCVIWTQPIVLHSLRSFLLRGGHEEKDLGKALLRV